MSLSRVDLPAPLSPTRLTRASSGTDQLIWSKMIRPPNDFEMLSSVSTILSDFEYQQCNTSMVAASPMRRKAGAEDVAVKPKILQECKKFDFGAPGA